MPMSQLWIVWAALLSSQLVYLMVPIPPREAVVEPVFVWALGFVALVEAVGIVVFLRVALFGPIRRGELDSATKPGEQRTFVVLLVAWTLAESIAIYGLVLRFLQFERPYTLPFAIAAALLCAYSHPWSSALRKPPSSTDLARSGTPIR
jgi:hypothetical protein